MPSRLTPLPGFSLKQVEVHSVVVDMPEIISLWKERFGVTEKNSVKRCAWLAHRRARWKPT
jgi:hypothetical protein